MMYFHFYSVEILNNFPFDFFDPRVIYKFLENLQIFGKFSRIYYWESDIEISDYDCGFILSSLMFHEFLFHVFETPLGVFAFGIFMSSCWIKPFIIMKWTSSALIISFVLKCTLSDTRVASADSFWLVLAWCIFFPPF